MGKYHKSIAKSPVTTVQFTVIAVQLLSARKQQTRKNNIKALEKGRDNAFFGES